MKLVLLRHGQSEWNLENKFTGWTDVDLTEKGKSEAKNAGKLIKNEKIKIEFIKFVYICTLMSVLNNKKILNASKLSLILNRLASQLFEKHSSFSNTAIIGIQPRGKLLSIKLKELIEKNYKISKIDIGFLDITFFRDDFGRENKILSANKTSIDFILEDKTVILVDDVLYTCLLYTSDAADE